MWAISPRNKIVPQSSGAGMPRIYRDKYEFGSRPWFPARIILQHHMAHHLFCEFYPPRMFDAAAKQAMSRWQFEPATENGQAVAKRATQTLNFQLNN